MMGGAAMESMLGVLWVWSLLVTLCVGDTTEFVLHDTTFTCMGQPYTDVAPKGWITDDQELVVVRNREDHDPCDVNGYPYKLTDLAPLRNVGKVVVAPLSNCSSWESWEDYRKDFHQRLLILSYTGPRGIIFGESHPGKLPEWFWNESELIELAMSSMLPPPVCVMTNGQFGELNDNLHEKGGHGADFTQAHLYRADHAPVLKPAISKIEILSMIDGNQHTFNVPAGASYFNPLETPAIEAAVAMPKFKDLCVKDPSNPSAKNFSRCTECWSSQEGPLLEPGDLQDKIAFFDLSMGSPPCYAWLYQFVILAQTSGARGVIFGGVSPDTVWLASPYLISEQVNIPTFSVSSTTAKILTYGINSTEISSDQVMVHLPMLNERSGVAFYAPEAFQAGLTDVAFWDNSNSASSNTSAHHFECSAEYTTITAGFQGIPPPVFNPNQTTGTRLKRGRPAESCLLQNNCGNCFHESEKVVFDSENTYQTGDVILISGDDFICLNEIHYLIEAVAPLNPSGLVLNLSPGKSLHAIANMTDYSFPVITIGSNCFTRVVRNLEETYVSFSRKNNGSQIFAGESMHAEHNKIEETVLKVSAPEDMRGAYLAGQSLFNPLHSFASRATLSVLVAKDDCDNYGTCHICDSLEWKFHDADGVDGHIVIFSGAFPVTREQTTLKGFSQAADPDTLGLPSTLDGKEYRIADQGWCLKPFTSIVQQAQMMGAIAVIFVNWDLRVFTYEVPGHSNITIPSFNVPLDVGIQLLWKSINGESVMLELPEIVNGTALTLEEFAVSTSHEEWVMHSSLQLALEEREGLIDLTRKRNAKSTKNWSASSSRIVTGIAVSVVGLLLVFGVVLLIWRTKSPHMRYRAFTDDKSVPIGASKAGAECLSRAQTESIQAGMYNPSDSQEIELSAVQDNISFDSALSPQEL